MSTPPLSVGRARTDPASLTPPGELASMLLIARRGALEALRDRMTVIMSLFFSLGFPLFMALAVVRPTVLIVGGAHPSHDQAITMALYLLIVGLLPSASAVGIASGQFAGEMEQGNLQPLLVSPASNGAIFGGKVLGSIIPSLLFAAIAEVAYLGGLIATVGIGTLHLLPVSLALAMVGLVPAVTLFAATVASLISSRVRTYNAAQQIGGFALVPLWGALFFLAARMVDWGAGSLLAAVLGVVAVDVVLVRFAAATWRREEVLAQR